MAALMVSVKTCAVKDFDQADIVHMLAVIKKEAQSAARTTTATLPGVFCCIFYDQHLVILLGYSV